MVPCSLIPTALQICSGTSGRGAARFQLSTSSTGHCEQLRGPSDHAAAVIVFRATNCTSQHTIYFEHNFLV